MDQKSVTDKNIHNKSSNIGKGEKNRFEGIERDNAILGLVNNKDVYHAMTRIVNSHNAEYIQEPQKIEGSDDVRKRKVWIEQSLKDNVEKHVKPLWELMIGESRTDLDGNTLDALRKFNKYVTDSVSSEEVPELIKKDLQKVQNLMQTKLEPEYWEHIGVTSPKA